MSTTKHIISRAIKRKTPDDDQEDVNVKKKRKLDNQAKILPIKTLQDKSRQTLDDIRNIFNTIQQSEIKNFAKDLLSVSQTQLAKIKHLETREKEMESFLRKCKYKCRDNYQLIVNLVKTIRNKSIEEIRECEYRNVSHNRRFKADIALRTEKPHKKYVEKMYELLSNYINQSFNLCSIICNYCHNGCIWYGFDICLSDDNVHNLECSDMNDGIMFNVQFECDDYFRDYMYYSGKKSQYVEKIKFESLKNDLHIQKLNDMNNEEISYLIAGIFDVLYGGYECIDHVDEEWIQKAHQ